MGPCIIGNLDQSPFVETYTGLLVCLVESGFKNPCASSRQKQALPRALPQKPLRKQLSLPHGLLTRDECYELVRASVI